MTNAYGVNLWRHIKSGWMSFSKLHLYDVRDGTRVKFWKHVWCGDCTLQEAFPELYCVSRTKDSSVAKDICWFGGRIHWDAKFCRPPQDWNKNCLICLWIWSTLRQYGDWIRIRFVGSQQGVEVLRLEDSIFLATLLPSYPSLGE